LLVPGLALAALIAWLVLGHQPAKPNGPPPVPVSVARVTQEAVPVSITALGAAQAWQGVLINPQISGRVIFVAKEGDDVRAGAKLVEIDCGPFLAALTQAQGALARDESMLAGAQRNLERFETLVAQNSIARQTLEDQDATVKQDQGVVLVDKGAVAAAQVNVRYCVIASPISGRVGVRLVDAGNVVTSTLTTGIVSVNQIQPIAVTFTVPQGDFQRLSAASKGFSIPLATEAFSQETGASLGSGQLEVADNHVDASTGTVQLKARFANDGRQLWPGQFVNVRLVLQTLPQAVTAPASAINQGPKGPYAYVVGPDGRVSLRPVAVATTQDATAVIQSGLRPGETVVTDGQMSLRPGLKVMIPGAAGPQRAGGGKRGA
jgi:multidrug efflux system membrane fusion protein